MGAMSRRLLLVAECCLILLIGIYVVAVGQTHGQTEHLDLVPAELFGTNDRAVRQADLSDPAWAPQASGHRFFRVILDPAL